MLWHLCTRGSFIAVVIITMDAFKACRVSPGENRSPKPYYLQSSKQNFSEGGDICLDSIIVVYSCAGGQCLGAARSQSRAPQLPVAWDYHFTLVSVGKGPSEGRILELREHSSAARDRVPLLTICAANSRCCNLDSLRTNIPNVGPALERGGKPHDLLSILCMCDVLVSDIRGVHSASTFSQLAFSSFDPPIHEVPIHLNLQVLRVENRVETSCSSGTATCP
jgi:hypothetical protein